jgi:hypothetical protein
LDLPTYTNIWRIEKRLYKLYDFRLPMPIPVGQIAVFAAIAVPYIVILKVVGLPFSHTLLWLYILPPGALAWLVTRPVLEGKRLPELVVSQLRYLGEPRTWCRMAPLAEKDVVTVVARVWRRSGSVVVGAELVVATQPAAVAPSERSAPVPQIAVLERPALERHLPVDPITAWPEAPARAASTEPPASRKRRRQTARAVPPAAVSPAPAVPARPAPATSSRSAALPAPAAPAPPARSAPPAAPARPAAAAPLRPVAAAPGAPAAPPPAVPSAAPPARPGAAAPSAAAASPVPPAPPSVPPAPPARPRPVVTVTGDQPGEQPIRMVERALGNPSQRRSAGWHDNVVVVPGGHRPGRPDPLQRDRARARLAISGPHRVVVLGCTVGAGQTMTALLTGEVLTSLRDEQIAALDLNPGPGSLAERAQAVPALTGSEAPAPSRLEVITRDTAAGDDEEDVTSVFELLSARYPLTLADPGAAAVPRVLAAADQLILVAPASQDAASALATTREWLEAHGHVELADGAITVLNGVSRHTMAHVEHAEALARGRCRAIVRVPWDDHLKKPGAPASAPAGPVNPAALQAYTALAGVLVAALATAPESLRGRS